MVPSLHGSIKEEFPFTANKQNLFNYLHCTTGTEVELIAHHVQRKYKSNPHYDTYTQALS